jgi:hypothetical protein
MPTYHILNGDCLAEQLKQSSIKNEYIICRECLIDGQVNAENIDVFWNVRAKFIANSYQVSAEEYFHKTVQEFLKVDTIPTDSEVCLWFENDLFCQVNMWFVLHLLAQRTDLQVFRIFPVIENQSDTWKGFGIATAEMLERAYATKVVFNPADIELGKQLWRAYQKADFDSLKRLSMRQSSCYQYLREVCQAHIDRFPHDDSLGRPQQTLKEIIATKDVDFQEVFKEFSDREGIYGFGDLQVKNMYNTLGIV